MGIFSVNQARHLFVAKAVQDTLEDLAAIGDVVLHQADKTKGTGFYVHAVTGKGDTLRSDIVYPGSVASVSFRSGSAMVPKARKYAIKVSSDILDTDGKVPKGYSFILNINYPTYQGMAEGESYAKMGDVFTRSAMTVNDFLAALGASIKRNVAHEAKIWPIIKVDIDSTNSVLYLTEVAQDWHRGTMALEILKFNVTPVPVVIDTIATQWAVVTDGGSSVTGYANDSTTDEVPFTLETAKDAKTGASLTNGRTIADLEYFFMGERGDIYRGIGWPNIVPTEYLVDPSKSYNVIDIDFYWAGDAEDVQKSPRVLTLVGESSVVTAARAKAIAAGLGLTTYFNDGVGTTTA